MYGVSKNYKNLFFSTEKKMSSKKRKIGEDSVKGQVETRSQVKRRENGSKAIYDKVMIVQGVVEDVRKDEPIFKKRVEESEILKNKKMWDSADVQMAIKNGILSRDVILLMYPDFDGNLSIKVNSFDKLTETEKFLIEFLDERNDQGAIKKSLSSGNSKTARLARDSEYLSSHVFDLLFFSPNENENDTDDKDVDPHAQFRTDDFKMILSFMPGFISEAYKLSDIHSDRWKEIQVRSLPTFHDISDIRVKMFAISQTKKD